MSYVAGEFKGDSMGDARLDERLHRIVSWRFGARIPQPR